MALYDGFFDAVLDENTLQYDRTYNSGDFTGYFEETVGSGVCIHENENSMKVSWDGTAAAISPGYLFIQGYWLKNTDDYAMPLTGEGIHAVLAQLNMGTRRIEVGSQLKADPETYPDALVLAYVTIDSTGAATVEDTRYNTDICGVIDSAGGLSSKVEWAINYIDNEIDTKLAEAEAAIEEQAALLDAKIEEVSYMVEKLAPPPIGTVKFSASQDIEEGWLRCDGSFINEADYPELVAALGKKYPSGDKFVSLSSGEIGTRPTNMVIYNSFLWVYSDDTKTLYRIDPDDGTTKPIPLKSSHVAWGTYLTNSQTYPIILSIVPHKNGATGAKLCIGQVVEDDVHLGEGSNLDITDKFLMFGADFTGDEDSLDVDPLVDNASSFETDRDNYGNAEFSTLWFSKDYLPFVTSRLYQGQEIYYCLAGGVYHSQSSSTYYRGRPLVWTDESTEAFHWALISGNAPGDPNYADSSIYMDTWVTQRLGYTPLNDGEAVGITGSTSASTLDTAFITSVPDRIYYFATSSRVSGGVVTSTPGNMPVVGNSGAIFFPSLTTNMAIVDRLNDTAKVTTLTLSLPSAARTFLDAGCYLWGKDMYFFFVGTGIIFFREFDVSAMGYLDTTPVLGTITQFGNIRYSQDEGTLYLLGQDTTNKVIVAKLVLNTLFDYANDGAWLPMIASDGIPAYIKAVGEKDPYAPEEGKVKFKGLLTSQETDSGVVPFSTVFTTSINGINVTNTTNPVTYDNPITLRIERNYAYTNSTQSAVIFGVIFGYGDTENINDVVWDANYAKSVTVAPGDSISISSTTDTLDLSSNNGKYFAIKFHATLV